MEGLMSDQQTWYANKQRWYSGYNNNERVEVLCTTGSKWWSWVGCKLWFYLYVNVSGNGGGLLCCLPLCPSWQNHIFVYGQWMGTRHQWCNRKVHWYSLEWFQGRSGLESTTVAWKKYAGPGHLDEHPRCRDSCSPQATVPPWCLDKKRSRCLEEWFASRS